ncbi:hypothetical protein HZA56_01045 [Candidatus Poribacteria bacterium]|nr:hypothetical protein [Candidatus Poribacteria bacterium]
MGRKSREKRLRREARNKRASELQLSEFQHPLAGIPADVLTQGLSELGRKQAEKFVATTSKAQELVVNIDPLCLMASMAAYGLTIGIGEDGSIARRNKQEILPAHVELVQALCLRLLADEHSHMPALPEVVQSVCDTLVDWSEQFHWKRLVQLEATAGEADRKRLAILEHMRLNTQVVRNWGYYDQVKRIALEVMAPLDARFEAHHGFRATDVIVIFDHLFHEWQNRINVHWNCLRGMMTAETLPEALAAYHSAFPDLVDTTDAFQMEMRRRRADLKTAKLMLLSHSDLRLPEICTFALSQVATDVGRPPDIVGKVLEKLGHRFGDLRGANVEHLFMSNPVWTKPIIKLDDGSYFCAMPQLFFAFLFESFLALAQETETLRSAYDDRRSDYLEHATAKLFEAAFPGATLTSNFKWQTPDRTQQFESDLIVQVDSFLILVEAKSGRVSPEARRGASGSLGEDIDRLLIEPSRQSQRLEEAIIAAKRGDAGTEEFIRTFPADLSTIHRVLRLSVTLDDIGFLQTNVNGLKEAGYVPTDLHVAPAVTLADLETVFDILVSQPERIHYWVRRSEWEGRADYMGDEIDLLGVYLKTGLNLGDLEFRKAHLVLVGESTPIDDYYEARREGISKERPRYRSTPWWQQMLHRLETQKPPRWIEAVVVLLCAGLKEQTEFEQRTKSVIADVKKNRERAASRNGLIYIPAKGRSEAIAALALMDTQIPERHRLMENLATHAFAEHTDVNQCVVVALNVDDLKYPYRSLACFTKPTQH